ncbi:MAG: flagellar protein FliS [Defluviitaleaceae bacterium]|nr:flagellar protein FliS [Defluviitaleaceae bacterium]
MDELTNRVVNATPLGLLIISYELLQGALHQAVEGIEAKDKEKALYHILHSQEILRAITAGLDLKQNIAKELLPIYTHMNNLLIDCQIKVNRDSLQEKVAKDIGQVKQMADILLEGIKTLPDVDIDKTKQVYAGLTYQKGGKLAEYVSNNEGTDYKV